LKNHQGLTGYERFLLDRIIANLDADNWCRLRNQELATKTGTTRKKVVKEIGILVKHDILIRERDKNGGGHVIERRLRIAGKP